MNQKIKIGPQIFVIKTKEDLRRGDEGLDGWIKFSTSEIMLETNLDAFSVKQCLWHEIVHGILTQAGIKTVPEEAVDALAYGILGVIQDNKWLIKDAECPNQSK